MVTNKHFFFAVADGVDDDDEDDVDDDHDGVDDDGLDDEDELEDDFDEYGHPVHGYHAPGHNTRIITTIPAKEPSMSAVPLKSALKKPRGMGSASTSNGIVASVTAINASSRNDKSSSDHSNSNSRYE